MIVNEDNYRIFEEVIKTTGTAFEIKWQDAENIKGYIDNDELLGMLEELLMEIDFQKEEYEELEKTIEEDYEPKRFDPYYEYGISENDFH